jgi:Tfp pilus assembly protein PilN
MIRINLLGQARPKAAKQAVPLEATAQLIFLVVALVVGGAVLGITYFQQKSELDRTNAKITQLQAEKASLQQVKADVDKFESEKSILQQRIDVIEELQRNRTGGQELLQSVANTVVRVDQVWLTSLSRTGDTLDIAGQAGSINAVANFITQMKRTGYFDKVEIKDAKENDLRPSVETFTFSMTAAISPNPQSEGQAKSVPTGAEQVSQPAAKGRS